MAGTFYEYFDGYVRVNFAMAGYGDIYIDFALHGDAIASIPHDDNLVKGRPQISVKEDVSIHTWTSSAICYFFADMVHWLEAIVCGVQECAFEWDGEGPVGKLRWFWGVNGSGRLQLSWSGHERAPEADNTVRVNKVQLVRTFYESFRGFVESGRYDPLDYEELSAGETFALVLKDGDLDALTGHVATLSRGVAGSFIYAMLDLACDRDAGYPRRTSIAGFMELAAHRHVDEPAVDQWIPVEWDRWDCTQRIRHIVETIYEGGVLMACGEKLRELRSPMVENWLAQHVQAEAQGTEKDGWCTN